MDIDPRNNEDLIRVAAVFGLMGGVIRLLSKQDFALLGFAQSFMTAVIVAVAAFVVMRGLVLAYDLAMMMVAGIVNAALWTAGAAFALFIAIVRGIVIDLPVILFRVSAALFVAAFSKDAPDQAPDRDFEPDPAPQRDHSIDPREEKFLNIINNTAATEGEKANARAALRRYRERKGTS
ncbi:hypothetical protein [Jiella mangrovi]|uniref:Phage holin family protein n=1 Tax=Jiella mangrovi TaxID=2821407 RepID=A0ABS4BNK6_9HYPH|nr:hypothetical protein [Jiella mangrovi]MBP0618309.1 hypothetical protein [Jiella mangrovi]